MTTITEPFHAPILARAASGRQALRASAPPLAFTYLTAIVCLAGLVAAAATEFFSMTVALHAQFPALSSGEDLGREIMPIRYAIAACLLLGHILLRNAADHLGRPVKWLLGGIGLVPIVAIIGGMAAFMFAATAQTTGAEDQQETLTALTGPALGIVCGAMFSISFLAAHALAGKLISSVEAIAAGRAHHAKVTDCDRALKAAESCHAQIEAARKRIVDLEKPDALKWKAATEAAGIVGAITSDAHDQHQSRLVRGNVELGPNDSSSVPDLPAEAFERRLRELERYTSRYFFDQLKQKEA
ncbi:MAG: hypothetical protein ACOY45_04570 [Pseudomonadota bacterium]